jgi:biotin transport system ATP-binding protein
MSKTEIIEIQNLSHRFADGTVGLDHIRLTICQGSFVVVVGRNGSGKTTLLRHLNGLLQPTEGAIRVAGLSVEKNLGKVRQIVGMVFQDADSQIVGETVYDDVAFGPENLCLDRNEIKRRVVEALDNVGLGRLADQQPHLLSAGEKRRLAIAGILVMNPEVIVFDEPFSNLDFPGLKQVLHQIVRLHRKGHTIVMTTHDVEAVIDYADRLLIISDGQVVKDGIPRQLVENMPAYGVRAPGRFHPIAETVPWPD